jgi:hypothetical protein
MSFDPTAEKPVRKSRHKISRHVHEVGAVLSGVPGLTPVEQVERVSKAQRALSKAQAEAAELLSFVNDRATAAAQEALASRDTRRGLKAEFQALIDALDA